MDIIKIQAIVAAAGLVNGLVLAIYLFFSKSQNKALNRILALAILGMSIKISYALFVFEAEASQMFIYTMYLFGMSGYYATPPLLYYYLIRKTAPKRKVHAAYWFSLVPSLYSIASALVALPALFMIPSNNETFFTLPNLFNYLPVAQAFSLVYIVFGFLELYKLKNGKAPKKLMIEFNWMRNLLIAYTLIWLAVILIIFADFQKVYIVELGMIYTFTLYLLIHKAVKLFWIEKGKQETPKSSYRKSKLDDTQAIKILGEIKAIMNRESLYENPELTLPKLATELKTTPHIVSEVINRLEGKNFAEFINSYRIEKAKQLLKDPSYSKFTISSIAYDCGFNTISTFNQAFKKMTEMTPAQFRA